MTIGRVHVWRESIQTTTTLRNHLCFLVRSEESILVSQRIRKRHLLKQTWSSVVREGELKRVSVTSYAACSETAHKRDKITQEMRLSNTQANITLVLQRNDVNMKVVCYTTSISVDLRP
jgi:hypothetical protein